MENTKLLGDYGRTPFSVLHIIKINTNHKTNKKLLLLRSSEQSVVDMLAAFIIQRGASQPITCMR